MVSQSPPPPRCDYRAPSAGVRPARATWRHGRGTPWMRLCMGGLGFVIFVVSWDFLVGTLKLRGM